MPDGKVHVAAAIVALLPAGAAAAGVSCYGWLPVAAGTVAYVVGTIWLSPDLDLVSQPYMAWGPLKWIWWPYMKLVPHRSWLSHGPIIGTLARTGVLLAYGAIVTAVLVWRGVITLDQVREAFRMDLWPIYSVLAGLEVSALVHIGLDKLLRN
jgi:uncharacterized metal-binding protein